MKRLLFIIIIACICNVIYAQIPVWNGGVSETFDGGEGTKDDPYRIATPEQLAKLSNDVNLGNSYDGTYFILTSDIDLGGKEGFQWTPIANSYKAIFNGFFDGNYKTIYNLNINIEDETSDYVGLFGNAGTESIITRVILTGAINVKNSYTGGIVGFFHGIMENCLSMIDITCEIGKNCGGCIGINYGEVRKCIYAGTLIGQGYCGGIAGQSRNCVDECLNLGLIKSADNTEWSYCGGIIGFSSGKVENLINAGSIYSSCDAGGIIGFQHMLGTVSNSLNFGSVFGIGSVGAIVGLGEGNVNLYYDAQASSGLMPGDSYYDSNENVAYYTSQLISGNAKGLNFSDNDKWIEKKGYYPQLKCFADSEIEIFSKLSNLSAVPVSTLDYEAFSALQNGFEVPSKMEYGEEYCELEYVSSVPSVLSFNGTECTFNAPAEDTEIEFYVGIKGSEYRKYIYFPFYGMFQNVETPSYSDDGGVRVYTLNNFANMAWFNGVANGLILSDEDKNAMPEYTTFSETIVKMGDDIDFGGKSWIPVGGVLSPLRYFGGKFDGCGYIVKNISINMPDEDKVAMFGYVGGNGCGISNIVLEGGRIVGKSNVAGIAAETVYGDFENCHNNSCNIEASYYASGVFGSTTASFVKNCSNSSNIICTNDGAAGVIYDFKSTDMIYAVCEGCFNAGKIYAEKGYSGGLICRINAYSIVTNCYNIGEIGGDNDVIGGIGAMMAQYASLSNCYNAGIVKRPEGFLGRMNMGEILGSTASEDITNAFYNFETAENMGGVADSDSYGTEGFATEEMQNNEQFVDMLGAGVWVMDAEGINDGYPILAWMSKAGIESPAIDGDGEGMKVYPTPCVDVIYVNGPDVCRIEVYDMSGKMVLSAKVAEGCGIDVSALAGGVYAVYGYDADGEAEVSKMIKR